MNIRMKIRHPTFATIASVASRDGVSGKGRRISNLGQRLKIKILNSSLLNPQVPFRYFL